MSLTGLVLKRACDGVSLVTEFRRNQLWIGSQTGSDLEWVYDEINAGWGLLLLLLYPDFENFSLLPRLDQGPSCLTTPLMDQDVAGQTELTGLRGHHIPVGLIHYEYIKPYICFLIVSSGSSITVLMAASSRLDNLGR